MLSEYHLVRREISTTNLETQLSISENLGRTRKKPLFRARKKKPSHAIDHRVEALRLWIRKCIPSVLLLPFKQSFTVLDTRCKMGFLHHSYTAVLFWH